MWMNVSEYRKKVEGCWMGKNIGGTLGAPFEGRRGVVDIDFYTQDLGGEPMPNLEIEWHLPEGWQIFPVKKANLALPQFNFGLTGNAEIDFTITPSECTEPRYDLLASVKSQGRHTHLIMPVTLLTATDGVSN